MFLYNDTMVVKARVEVLMDCTRGGNGWSSLHFACMNGHRKTARQLLLHDAEINLQNFDGNTALHLAACNNKADVVSMLLESGANVSLRFVQAYENRGGSCVTGMRQDRRLSMLRR